MKRQSRDYLKRHMFLAVAVLVAVSTSQQVHATPALSIGGVAATGNGPFTVGWSFLTNTALTVSDLGIYDNNGLNGPHDVGIWTSGGGLLGSVTVNPADTLINGFRYSTLGSPVLLGAGQVYVVGAANPNGDDYVAASSFTTIPEINFIEGRFVSGGPLQFPTSVDNTGAASIFGANFLASAAVPEPGSFVLMGIGLVGLALSRKRV